MIAIRHIDVAVVLAEIGPGIQRERLLRKRSSANAEEDVDAGAVAGESEIRSGRGRAGAPHVFLRA